MPIQVLLQGLPVVFFPSHGKVFGGSVWEPSMLQNNLAAASLVGEFELDDRKVPGLPALRMPYLNYSFVRHEFDLPARHVPTEDRKGAAGLAANLRRFCSGSHRTHGGTEPHDFVELSCIRQCFISALWARAEDPFLANRFRPAGDPKSLFPEDLPRTCADASKQTRRTKDCVASGRSPAQKSALLVQSSLHCFDKN